MKSKTKWIMSLAANSKYFGSVSASRTGQIHCQNHELSLRNWNTPENRKSCCLHRPRLPGQVSLCILVMRLQWLETNQKSGTDARLSILWHWFCSKVFKAVTLVQSQWIQVSGPVLKNWDKLIFHRLRLLLHKVISVLESHNNSCWKTSQEI